MKNIALAGATMVLAMSAGTASAGPTIGKFGINIPLATPSTPAWGGGAVTPVDSSFLIKGKYVIQSDMAVLAGAGLRVIDHAAGFSETQLGFMGGARKYLKTDDFAPFVGGRLTYISSKPGGGTTTQSDFELMGEAGAEYFLGKQFSVEGSVGVGYASVSVENPGAPANDKSAFGTTSLNLSANFYF